MAALGPKVELQPGLVKPACPHSIRRASLSHALALFAAR
ncbi:MAG: hypothetical protein CISAcid_09100 [uncultured Acidilobus sp. CIS]|nr:MAG: hypothetical protein CISAcid_09100 [uncultured Acidilobus sp. CIS]